MLILNKTEEKNINYLFLNLIVLDIFCPQIYPSLIYNINFYFV